ncbi:hypothetical protein [Sandarakinorhabdus sp.]|uniref:hypothetical protein n=1 Tax=Sandarakinorhabdus sp. TaxID=1916663 RepID=UPI003F6F10E3
MVAERSGAPAGGRWDPRNTSAMLHRITPTRLAHIREAAVAHFGLNAKSRRPLAAVNG